MKLINKIRKAEAGQAKTDLWLDADLSVDQSRELVMEMILSLPKGCYRLYSKEYGNNLCDAVYDHYGFFPSMMITETFCRGLNVMNEKKFYAAFTLGMDAIEIK
jgi:hypothetical protein